eukprot:1136681-Pelagomonas_calceolata.AAC.6
MSGGDSMEAPDFYGRGAPSHPTRTFHAWLAKNKLIGSSDSSMPENFMQVIHASLFTQVVLGVKDDEDPE